MLVNFISKNIVILENDQCIRCYYINVYIDAPITSWPALWLILTSVEVSYYWVKVLCLMRSSLSFDILLLYPYLLYFSCEFMLIFNACTTSTKCILVGISNCSKFTPMSHSRMAAIDM